MIALYDNDWKFQLAKWRNLVQTTGERIFGSMTQTIVPFGFEVTNDLSYLSKNLNRFYCYFYNPQLQHSLKYEEQFANELLNEIKSQDIIFFERISVIVYENDKIKTKILKDFEKSSILINIEQRHVNRELLTDYAEYLLCCDVV